MVRIFLTITALIFAVFLLMNANAPASLGPVTLRDIQGSALPLEFPGGGKVFVTEDPGVSLGIEGPVLGLTRPPG